MGIVSYGENVTHRVNLSQFDNRESLLRKVRDLPQDTGIKTMTAWGIETARYREQNPSADWALSYQGAGLDPPTITTERIG